ncbi:hypothetical protein HYT57_01910 [Candidatus Woesearchaeota archaeon]|nr:hypothetical protein [Candidatus Woesearchaeota archaeon]
MVKVKNVETTTKNWVEGSIIKAYMREEKDLNWVLGIIRDANMPKEKLREMFDKLGSYYGTESRFQELQKKCNELKFL